MKHFTEEAVNLARAANSRAESMYQWACEESGKDPENKRLRDVRGEACALRDLTAQALRAAQEVRATAAHAEDIRAWYVKRGLPLPGVNPTGVALNRDGTSMLPPVALSEVGGDPEDRL